MGTIKKISCIVFILLLILPFSVFAEPSELSFSGYSLFRDTTNDSGNRVRWYQTMSTLGSSTWDSFSLYPFHDYDIAGCGASIADSNGVLTDLKAGWTYVISFSMWFRMPVVNGSSIVTGPPYEFLQASTTYHPWETSSSARYEYINGQSVEGFNTERSLEVLTSDINSNGEGNMTYVQTFTFTFRVPDTPTVDFTGLHWLLFSLRFMGSDSQGGGSVNFYASQIYGTYDPSGELIEDETEIDQIVAGQKEAAQYALDQEQQANEDAYDGAVEQDTSVFDLSDLVGSFSSLYTGLTYSGTDFNFKFPSSGVVPGFDMQLWDEQDIPLKYYIDQIPEPILIIIRAVFWIFVAICVIRMIYKVLGFINGHKGDD